MRLQYKIVLSIFAILMVLLGLGAALSLHFQTQATSSQFEQSALTLARTLRDSLEYVMLQGDSEAIRSVVSDIASAEDVSEVSVLSADQRVYASGDAAAIGQVWDDDLVAQVLASGDSVTRSKRSSNGSQLGVILPVFNAPQCYPCHGSETAILGTIEIGLDRQPLDDQLGQQSLLIGVVGLVTLVSVGGTLTLLIRTMVLAPLAKMDSSVRSIAGGDFAARVDVTRKDELGALAQTFNGMAARIQQYSSDLQKSKGELENQSEQMQQMAAIRGQLIDRLVSMEEEERRRIARELHDESGQALTIIMMNLARAADDLPADAVEARNRLLETRRLAEQTLRDLKKLIYDLRPEVLDELGLVPALRSYARSHLEPLGFEVKLRFIGPKTRIPPRVEIVLFRVIQEAITNIIRHSAATRVEIELSTETDGSQVFAMVEDNGRGFDVVSALTAPGSWGLRGIRERVATVNGILTINSTPSQGTRIQVRIPLPEENGSHARPDSG